MADIVYLADKLKKLPGEIMDMTQEEIDWCIAYFTYKMRKQEKNNNINEARAAARGRGH